MTMPAIITSDRFEVALVHSDSGLGGKSRQLVDLNGSYRAKSYDMKGMGTNAQVNDLGLMTMIANTQSLVLSGEPTEIESLVDNAMHQRFDIELLRAFGVEVATMGDFIQEVMAGLGENSPLTPEQKSQLQDLVGEIITLKKLTSLGVLPQGTERLQMMIAATAEKIADILKDGLDNRALSKAVTEFAYNMLDKTVKTYGLNELSEKLVAIEGRMNPQNYMVKSVAELVTQLTALLEQPDIEDALKDDITKMLDDLADREQGQPLPRDILKQLDALVEKLPETHAVKIQKSIETVRDANSVLKAEISGMTVAQVQKVESLITELDVMKDGLSQSNEPLTTEQKQLIEQLDQTIQSLDANPADIKAAQSVEKLQSRLSVPDIAMALPVALAGAVGNVLAKLSPVQIIQETTLAERHHVNIAQMRTIIQNADAPKIIASLPVAEVKTVATRIADTVKTMAAYVPFIPKNTTATSPENPVKTRDIETVIPANDVKSPHTPPTKGDVPSKNTETVSPEPTKNDGGKGPDSNQSLPENKVNPDPRKDADNNNNVPAETPVTPNEPNPDDSVEARPEAVPNKPDDHMPADTVKTSCGDHCQCKTDFNVAASGDLTPEKIAEINVKLEQEFGDKYQINKDGTVTALDQNGKPETITREEMTTRIEVDRIVEQVNPSGWDKLVDMAGGDRDKAIEIYKKNAELENAEIKNVATEKGVTNISENTVLDAAIAAAQERIKAAQRQNGGHSKSDYKRGDKLKHIFCPCCTPDKGNDPKPGQPVGQPTPPVKKEVKKRQAPKGDANSSEPRTFKGRTRTRNPS